MAIRFSFPFSSHSRCEIKRAGGGKRSIPARILRYRIRISHGHLSLLHFFFLFQLQNCLKSRLRGTRVQRKQTFRLTMAIKAPSSARPTGGGAFFPTRTQIKIVPQPQLSPMGGGFLSRPAHKSKLLPPPKKMFERSQNTLNLFARFEHPWSMSHTHNRNSYLLIRWPNALKMGSKEF